MAFVSPIQDGGDDEEGAAGPIPDVCGAKSSPRPSPPPSQHNGVSKQQSKRIVTLSLLRKRSEHNEGLVSSLEELALHQEELHSVGPVLGRTCGRTLRILLLQNNVIERMDPAELKLFRSLEYLNLALNNISKIEGLGSMEWLRKLDLTLNFLDVDALEESVDELSECPSLEELFLLGNPCMGLGVGIPGVSDSASDGGATFQRDQIGWSGCRAYVVARLPGLYFLDGKEIKRSERILATQQLPALTSELNSLAEKRREERRLHNQSKIREDGSKVDESHIADDAPTHHDPETRIKLSNELHDQKQAKEKQEAANQAPKPKGEREWEEEHKNAIRKAREREERGKEWESANNKAEATKKNGGIKQCNQGKYKFWFMEESNGGDSGKTAGGSLIMHVALPKHLSTSLIDVDIHPTYVSVVIKSKILRVVLPAEVISTDSVARRSAASGCLELVMRKSDPNEAVVGTRHFRHKKTDQKAGVAKSSCFDASALKDTDANENEARAKKRQLGQLLMKEAGIANSLKIVGTQGLDSENSLCSDDDNDTPPPIF